MQNKSTVFAVPVADQSSLCSLNGTNSGDYSVRIDFGMIHTMEQVNYSINSAIKHRQKEKSREL